jgi:DNA-binding transcriptional ArsR family regulator
VSEWPIREITDPRMLRAMAHPLRIKLLNQLAVFGPATATELAEKLGDTAANCSWHLRQLAKFGLIEDMPGPGRNRPWRWIPTGNRWRSTSPEMAQAGAQVAATMLDFEMAQLQAWEASEPEAPAEWREAAFVTQAMSWLTAAELAEINKTVMGLLLKSMDRLTDHATRPPGSRPVRFIAWGIPCDLS